MGKARAKGTRLETAFVDFARAHGFPFARRLALAGSRDVGDVALSDDLPLVIEVKNQRELDLGSWMTEAQKGAINAGCLAYAVVHNRKGKADRDNYATLPWWLFLDLVQSWARQRELAAELKRSREHVALLEAEVSA